MQQFLSLGVFLWTHKSAPRMFNLAVMLEGDLVAYATHINISTTVFWVGEEGTPDSAFIPNYQSAWDGDWLHHYGGVDSADHRAGGLPLLFTPLENPFYFALPYNDFDAQGNRRADAASIIPWSGSQVFGADQSMLKNRWIRIDAGGTTVYAQWEDVGPNSETDQNYVFGSAAPGNTFGAHAGLDVSPAVMSFLGQSDVFTADWQFVDFVDVPDGPWKTTITTSQVTYDQSNEHPTGRADFIIGTPAANRISAGAGADTIFGSGGIDRLAGQGGNDHVYGGTGDDLLSGGSGFDIIEGESGSDVIDGGRGNDRLFGDRGRDTIIGGKGSDSIEGDGGADVLTGGQGADYFVFRSANEIGRAFGHRDVITDFRHGLDHIDLSAIDAAFASPGDQAFNFIGRHAFTGHAAELHAVHANGSTFLEGDVNGDRHADFSLEFAGAVRLTLGDFVL